MKNIKLLYAFAIVIAITVSAFAVDPKFSYDGYVEVHYGFERVKTDYDSKDIDETTLQPKETTNETFSGYERTDDFEFDLNANLEAGKFTGLVSYGADGTEGNEVKPVIENFWLSYQFTDGISFTYNAIDSQYRWGEFEDICTDHDTTPSIDFIANGIFVTIVGSNPIKDDDSVVTAPGYTNGYYDSKDRVIPLTYFGYSSTIFDTIDLTIGGLYDRFKGKYKNPEAEEEEEKKIGYTGWMGYTTIKYTISKENEEYVEFDGFYGVNSLYATNFKFEGEDSGYGNITSTQWGTFNKRDSENYNDKMYGTLIDFSAYNVLAKAYYISGIKDKDSEKREVKLNYDIWSSFGYTFNITDQISLKPTFESCFIKAEDRDGEKKDSSIKPYIAAAYKCSDQFIIGSEVSYEMATQDCMGRKTKINTLAGQINLQYTF